MQSMQLFWQAVGFDDGTNQYIGDCMRVLLGDDWAAWLNNEADQAAKEGNRYHEMPVQTVPGHRCSA